MSIFRASVSFAAAASFSDGEAPLKPQYQSSIDCQRRESSDTQGSSSTRLGTYFNQRQPRSSLSIFSNSTNSQSAPSTHRRRPSTQGATSFSSSFFSDSGLRDDELVKSSFVCQSGFDRAKKVEHLVMGEVVESDSDSISSSHSSSPTINNERRHSCVYSDAGSHLLKEKESPSIQDLQDFPHARFEGNQQIGKGSFGFVFAARDHYLNRNVVIKRIPKNQIDSALQEWESGFIMYGHPHIPKVYTLYKDNDFLYLVQDWVKGKDLAMWMRGKKRGMQEDVALYILKRVVKIVIDLHIKGVVHRDIKPGNILLESRQGDLGRVWLIDLGSSSSHQERSRSFVGTISHMAPEVGDESYDEKVDVWSLGIVFFYMMTGDLPFSTSLYDFWNRASNGKKGFILTEKMNSLLENQASFDACDLLRKMLEIDPVERLSLQSVLNHPWMAQEGRSWTLADICNQSLESSSNESEGSPFELSLVK